MLQPILALLLFYDIKQHATEYCWSGTRSRGDTAEEESQIGKSCHVTRRILQWGLRQIEFRCKCMSMWYTTITSDRSYFHPSTSSLCA